MGIENLTIPDATDEIIIYIEMVEMISKESGLRLYDAIYILALYYNENYEELLANIKDLKPEWFGQNTKTIVGYIDDQPIYFNQFGHEYRMLYKKIRKKVIRLNIPLKLTPEDLLVVTDQMVKRYKISIDNIFQGV